MLEQEEITPAGHDFKLQLFKDGDYETQEGSEFRCFGTDQFDMYLSSILMDYDVDSFKTHQRKHWETGPIDRHRAFFTIKDKDMAMKCYSDFHFQKVLVEGARYKLYLIKQEEIFTRYGDIEAAKFA